MSAGYITPGVKPSELDEFYVHEVTVETVTGGGPFGDITTTNGPYKCFVSDKRSKVLDEQGSEVISSTTVTTYPEYRDYFTPGSTVILPSRRATVIALAVNDSGPLGLPDHIQVSLT